MKGPRRAKPKQRISWKKEYAKLHIRFARLMQNKESSR